VISHCEICGRPTRCLIRFLTGEPDFDTQGRPIAWNEYEAEACRACAETVPDNADNFEHTDFNLNLFKGKLGQVIVETVLLEFNYSVFPYGYESYFTNLIKSLTSSYVPSSLKIRSMPDLVAVSPESGDVYLLEVKATTSDANDYMLGETTAQRYLRNWPEAVLTVYSVKERNIFAAELLELDLDRRQISQFRGGQRGFAFDLHRDFYTLDEYLDLPRHHYARILNQVHYRLDQFRR
jgi:hypothetical protein